MRITIADFGERLSCLAVDVLISNRPVTLPEGFAANALIVNAEMGKGSLDQRSRHYRQSLKQVLAQGAKTLAIVTAEDGEPSQRLSEARLLMDELSYFDATALETVTLCSADVATQTAYQTALADQQQVQLRFGTPADAPTLARFNGEAAWSTEQRKLDESAALDGVMGLFARPQLGFWLVATAHEEIIGMTMVTYEWSDWRNGVVWWLQSVYTREDWRNRGIFRRIYRRLQQLAAESAEPVRGFRLYAEQNNQRAIQIYQRLGMKCPSYFMFEAIGNHLP